MQAKSFASSMALLLYSWFLLMLTSLTETVSLPLDAHLSTDLQEYFNIGCNLCNQNNPTISPALGALNSGEGRVSARTRTTVRTPSDIDDPSLVEFVFAS
eukprot:6207641-Pleurochrysis_carterae.AAC.3